MEIKIRYVFEDKNGHHLLVPYTIEQIDKAKEGFVSLIERTFAEGLKLKDRNLFTGLPDINGTEIYEGDILVDFQGTLGRVFYHDGAFRLSSDQCNLDLDNVSSYDDLNKDLIEDNHLTVIGNIYTNPELISQNF